MVGVYIYTHIYFYNWFVIYLIRRSYIRVDSGSYLCYFYNIDLRHVCLHGKSLEIYCGLLRVRKIFTRNRD